MVHTLLTVDDTLHLIGFAPKEKTLTGIVVDVNYLWYVMKTRKLNDL